MARIRWFTRTSRIIALCSAANFINSADRVIMPIAIVPMTEIFGWSLHEQGWILSALACGYLSSQIIGSLYLPSIGVKNMLVSSVLLWSIATIITPLVSSSIAALIVCRIILGFAEGLGLPTIFHLFANSIPTEGRSRAFGYLIAAGSVGQTVASVFTPHMHWANTFYIFGGIGLLWVVMWLSFYPDRPLGDVDQYIPMHETQPNVMSFKGHLLKKLFCRRALWALYVAHFAMNWASYIVMQWLPTYLSRTLGADAHSLSLTAVPHILNSICGVISGHLADSLLLHKSWSVLNVRRLMTSIGLVGPALFLSIFCVVDERFLAIVFISVSMGLSACNYAGHLSNHVDVAPNHSGITFAISNTIATIPGVICGPLTAHLVTSSSWVMVYLISTAINLLGALFYFTNCAANQVI
ncbi:PREDICTED: sodium-dependent phosphate transport protein 1, chloroplastic-like [Nicrophorus vespilloides]|uniref:Sodium-dependent phosphate transport protein 1, chloroplastic-like n=1 Tax=Nicrophorus vespilloides TaxID=110193 RepID=A0ABM1NEE4_NICVS|nr:PREDICTED: sodium-dependent phosphate transport protein 1, chloroplastic-like [Nicrophorus vespilloides]